MYTQQPEPPSHVPDAGALRDLELALLPTGETPATRMLRERKQVWREFRNEASLHQGKQRLGQDGVRCALKSGVDEPVVPQHRRHTFHADPLAVHLHHRLPR